MGGAKAIPINPIWRDDGFREKLHLLRAEDFSDEGEPIGRIISARKATAHERKAYEEGNF
jgi:hypothetical protein